MKSDELKFRYNRNDKLYFAIIDDQTTYKTTKEWTSTRFTWGEGYNEYDCEEGLKIENVKVEIVAIDNKDAAFYRQNLEEIKTWLFSYTTQLYDDNIPVQIYRHIKRRMRCGPAVFKLKDNSTIVFYNAQSFENVKELFQQAEIVDTIEQSKEEKYFEKN